MSNICIPIETIRKLLTAGNGDAVLLYLCRLASMGDDATGFSDARISCTESLLRKLNLDCKNKTMSNAKHHAIKKEDTANKGMFNKFVKEVERCLGRNLRIVDLEILASIYEKLQLNIDVLNVLVHYCIERDRADRADPKTSIHAVEKEAYLWADKGINTIEKAAAYIQEEKKDTTRLRDIYRMLGIGGRRITEGEKQYIQAWFDMGFQEDAIYLAYTKTCQSTGGLTWKYMNGILESWNKAGLYTVAQIDEFDKKPARKNKRKNGYIKHDDPPTPGMIEAIRQMLEED